MAKGDVFEYIGDGDESKKINITNELVDKKDRYLRVIDELSVRKARHLFSILFSLIVFIALAASFLRKIFRGHNAIKSVATRLNG